MWKNLLGDFAPNVMHGPTIFTLKTSTRNASMIIHPRRVMTSSPLLTLDLLDICIFSKFLSLWLFAKSKFHGYKS